MFEINKTAIGIAAGVAGTLFLGYCVYFDKKRRSDPEYKKKVRERRQRNRNKATASKNGLPDLNDHEQIERYFLQEIQLGETLISRGEFEKGVEHLSNAIVVCGQPGRLLQVLQTSLPAQVFGMLILKMQEIGGRYNSEQTAAAAQNQRSAEVLASDGSLGAIELQSSVAIDDLE